MPGRFRPLGPHSREIFSSGWELARSRAEDDSTLQWHTVDQLDTVAAMLRARGEWSLDAVPRRFDSEAWWLRRRFDAPPTTHGSRIVLGFDGLAGLAEAWLNDEPLLKSDNMFHEHEIALSSLMQRGNELRLKFDSLDARLAGRRPRPRWRAPMVENQQLRWFRTTLLGRTPGWSPPAPPIGPWRPVWLETRNRFDLLDLSLRTRVEGSTGIVALSCRIEGLNGAKIDRVELVVTRGEEAHRGTLHATQQDGLYSGSIEIPRVALWWPHTHGDPSLYDAKLTIGDEAVDLRRIGFRTLSLETREGDFELRVNNVPVFCRGACWTPCDVVSPNSNSSGVDTAVAQARAAGFNMLRVNGTMVYESDRFLDTCDEQGVLLWQDFMFANMEYPRDDAEFESSVRHECAQLLERFAGRPCLAILCGNSEAEQQAAMWGAPREWWSQRLFDELLREECTAHAPEVPYWPSSAHGGAFPHQSNSGTSSYYGVGAYRRPLADARLAEVRFATECLAFANVPEDIALKVHDPGWKARVPRDLGAGWDFDDVRDHYLREIFRVDPVDLRYADHERYLILSRLASAEAMAAAFREWRRRGSACRGALILFLKDLWPGAGWGIVDAAGNPKAPWYLLRRLLQSRTVFMTDEGCNGLLAHVVNERPQALEAYLDWSIYRADGLRIAQARQPIQLAPHSTMEVPAVAALEGFSDLTYAYRFGPPQCETVVATLSAAAGGAMLAEDFYFPLGLSGSREADPGVTAVATVLADGQGRLALKSRSCARHVRIHVEGFEPQDQYFHLAPGVERLVELRRIDPAAALKGTVLAANASITAQFGGKG